MIKYIIVIFVVIVLISIAVLSIRTINEDTPEPGCSECKGCTDKNKKCEKFKAKE